MSVHPDDGIGGVCEGRSLLRVVRSADGTGLEGITKRHICDETRASRGRASDQASRLPSGIAGGPWCGSRMVCGPDRVFNLWPRSALLRQHGAVEVAVIGREADGLRFEEVRRGSKAEIWSVVVRLRVPGLDASHRVWSDYTDSFGELVAFFNGLAADWRGWPGERTYETQEHDLRLTAAHDGRVHLIVQLQETSGRGGWSATGVVQLDPGEEMTRAAEDVAALLSPSEP